MKPRSKWSMIFIQNVFQNTVWFSFPAMTLTFVGPPIIIIITGSRFWAPPACRYSLKNSCFLTFRLNTSCIVRPINFSKNTRRAAGQPTHVLSHASKKQNQSFQRLPAKSTSQLRQFPGCSVGVQLVCSRLRVVSLIRQGVGSEVPRTRPVRWWSLPDNTGGGSLAGLVYPPSAAAVTGSSGNGRRSVLVLDVGLRLADPRSAIRA